MQTVICASNQLSTLTEVPSTLLGVSHFVRTQGPFIKDVIKIIDTSKWCLELREEKRKEFPAPMGVSLLQPPGVQLPQSFQNSVLCVFAEIS